MSNNYSRIALVTGATSGIGEAIVRKFIASGYAIVGSGRKADKLAALEKELGQAFCGLSGDAADEALLEKLFAAAEERFKKPVDIVVANAGRGLGGSVKDADISQFKDVIDVNVVGALALLQKAARRMVELQKNRYPKSAADIIVIGSVAGRNVSPFSAVYGSTKFAVGSLAEGLRREIGPKGVRVTLVAPGIVISGFQEVAGYSDEMVQGFHDKFGPVLVPEDVANAIQFIVSQPPHIHISDIVIRPTRQDYP
jgi:NADP-dependent 3-hydroxy acid dehydrogenase YdfG